MWLLVKFLTSPIILVDLSESRLIHFYARLVCFVVDIGVGQRCARKIWWGHAAIADPESRPFLRSYKPFMPTHLILALLYGRAISYPSRSLSLSPSRCLSLSPSLSLSLDFVLSIFPSRYCAIVVRVGLLPHSMWSRSGLNSKPKVERKRWLASK